MDKPDTYLYIYDMPIENFLSQIDPTKIGSLFEEIPEIYFFAKDLEGRFTMANMATVKTFGYKKESELLGKTDFGLAPVEIASKYKEADEFVIKNKQAIRDIIEPVPDPNGVLQWYSTTKAPLFNKENDVIGVAVIMRDISSVAATLGPFQEMAEVIDYIFKNYKTQITIDDLAKVVKLSSRQVERRFKKLFGLTPIRYINEHRIRMACIKLRESQKNIAEIAKEVGFYDHAHFVHKFRMSMNLAPSEYRAKY